MQDNGVSSYFGGQLYELFFKAGENFLQEAEEIRIRTDKPLIIYKKNSEYTITASGMVSKDIINGYRPAQGDISKTVELMSNYSLYALQDELRSGYLTLPGGHRVGIGGKIVTEHGIVKTISHISAMNIRVSHEVPGCADAVMQYITSPECLHTVIISPPGCGKTTLLRDMVRQMSDGTAYAGGIPVGLVDERSEIAGAYKGVPQNDIGIRTDVLDGCPKAQGMTMLLRSMAPRVIAVDEIGRREDIEAIDDILNAGVKILCTVHGNSIEELLKKPILGELFQKRIFERYILLGYDCGPGFVKGIYDKNYGVVMENAD